MPKDIDQRDYSFTRAFDPQAAAAKSSKKLQPSHKLVIPSNRVNLFLGGAEYVESVYEGGGVEGQRVKVTLPALPQKELSDQTVTVVAAKHLERIATALGFHRGVKAEFVPDPYVKRTSAGTRIVNFLQHYWGIPVFQMERTVELDRRGAIKCVDGMSASLPHGLEIVPSISLENAARAAAEYVSSPSERIDLFTKKSIPDPVINWEEYQPKVIARMPFTSQPSVLDKGPFGEAIPAHLVFFYMGRQTRLGWHFLISTPGIEDQYVVIVEADPKTKDPKRPEVLYGKRTSNSMVAANGNVWAHNPKANATRQVLSFPRPVSDYPIEPIADLPQGFPFPWILDGMEVTEGNNTIAGFGEALVVLRRTSVDQGVLVFDPPETKGNDQKVLNAFYFANFMHDFFFMLGFDEALNFQVRNFTGIGAGGDPVQIIVSNRREPDLASMNTLADGRRAVMRLGTASVSDATLNTALDSDIVFHEYTHGVTRRMVGRSLEPDPLQLKISDGLSEGWSDYFALTIQNYDLNPEVSVLGDYLFDGEGIRSQPYDDNYATNNGVPETDPQGVYGRIGLGIYTDRHPIGEIWCAALVKMNRDLGKAFVDKKRGHRLGWQIVYDGLKKLPAEPHFIQARDRILSALDDLLGDGKLILEDHRKARRATWQAFAHFGIGFRAGPSKTGTLRTEGDKSLPPDL